jgi:Ca2+-dependent lipid-binding protein
MNGVLKLQVIKANLVQEVFPPQTMNPFFIASVSSSKIYRSNIRNNEGKYPLWNEESQFQINNGENDLSIVIYSGQTEVFKDYCFII